MKHADVPFVIDFHTHMLDEELRAICTSRNAITGFGKKQAPPSANLRRFLDPELQIADMDERGIDMHVVFTGPVHMSTWWADPQTAAKLTPPNVDGGYLGDRKFWPLWQAIRDHDIVAFIHPEGIRDPWYHKFALW